MTGPIAIAAALLALLFLRGRTLAAWAATAAGLCAVAWLASLRLPPVDPPLAAAAVGVTLLALLALFVARGADVRFGPTRAAVATAIVYGFVIAAMLRLPIDGDEPFYLLLTESIAHDADLDLANQYTSLGSSATGRTDLVPQPGDPVGANGERYSRHEPFLPALMVPGYLLGGLAGAIATIALFGALLVRSSIRWMEDEGIGQPAIRAVFPFLAFAPPVLFYATRIWPEVPAAFCFVEAVRGLREQRAKRWVPALLGLVLLKLRFVLLAVALLAPMLLRKLRGGEARGRRIAAAAVAIVVLPMLVMWLVSGNPTSVHGWQELVPAAPDLYVTGFFGLLTDGMSGLAFQAPFYLIGLAALLRWRSAPAGFRLGVIGALLYVFYLVPRREWFGGWAPPLRYLVFLMPVLALGAAWMWERVPRAFVAIAALWTGGLAIHGLAYPHRLFHIFDGENPAGEWLSLQSGADFSRLFPSFIRTNDAAWIGAAVVVALVVAFAVSPPRAGRSPVVALQLAAVALALTAAVAYGFTPAARVDFEDEHVQHHGGRLHPELYAVVRTMYRGGWVLEEGDSLSFLAQKGNWTLHYVTGLGALVEIDGQAQQLPAAEGYQTARVTIRSGGRVTLRCLSGAVNVDRMVRDE